jgi:hypothetical protein
VANLHIATRKLKKKIVINSILVNLSMQKDQTAKKNAFDFAKDACLQMEPNKRRQW